MKAKIIFLVLILSAVSVVGCVKRSELAALEKDGSDLAQEGMRLRNEIKIASEEFRRRERLVSQFQELQEKEAEMKLEMEAVTNYVDQLKSAHEHVYKALPIWKQATRRSLVGLRLGNVNLLSGKTLIEAEVVEVGDETVQFKQTQGVIDVRMDDLPESVRLTLVHEPTILARTKIGN